MPTIKTTCKLRKQNMNCIIRKKSKKSLSEIITLIILILVSMVAMIVIYQFINKEATSLSPENSCAEFSINKILELNKVCYNENTGDIEAEISRYDSNINIDKIGFMLDSNSETKKWECCLDNCDNCQILNPGETKTYYMSLNEFNPNSKLLIYSSSCLISEKKIEEC
jgi:hypothetical protein